jgi:sialate O-acetylesterase
MRSGSYLPAEVKRLLGGQWGGTPIASWLSGPSLAGAPTLAPFLTYWQNAILQYPANQSRYEQAVKKWEAGGSQGPRPAVPLGPGHQHEPATLYNAMMAPLITYTIKGARVKRKQDARRETSTARR